jgi:hypothetical protein
MLHIASQQAAALHPQQRSAFLIVIESKSFSKPFSVLQMNLTSAMPVEYLHVVAESSFDASLTLQNRLKFFQQDHQLRTDVVGLHEGL